MKHLIIFLILPISLFSNTITFNELYEKALLSSSVILEINENLKIEENVIKTVIFPSGIKLSSFITPSYTLSTTDLSNGEFDLGGISLNIIPFYNTSINLSYAFENPSSLSFTFTPFESKRSIIYAKNSFEIYNVETKEQLEGVYKKIMKLYSDLYFLKEEYKLDKLAIDILNKEILVKENLLNMDKISSIDIDDLYIELLNEETNLINKELIILQNREELSNLTGININEDEFILDDSFGVNRDNNSTTIFEESIEYLKIKESIRDQKLALKECKNSIIPKLSFTGGVSTNNFVDYTGYISIGGNFSFNFSYASEIENEELILKQLERKLEDSKNLYINKMKLKERTKELNSKQIDILNRSLESSNKRLLITEYRFKNGNILEYEYNRVILNNKRLKLNLNQSRVNLLIN